MCLVQHDHLVQALSAKRTYEPLRERVLPRGLRGRDQLLDPQHLCRSPEALSVDPVPVTYQEPRRLSSGNACMTCQAVHSAVGFAVALKCNTRRR